jgi:hypothetical protein
MSRKVLIIAAVVALLVATLAVPAMDSAFEAEDAAPAQTETGPEPSAHPSVSPPRIQVDGGCEGGNGGGCAT